MTETNVSPVVEFGKWLVVAILLAAAAGINVAFSEESLLYRVLGIVAVGLVAGFIALQTVKGLQFANLIKEARIEIRKVVWPSHQETLQTTLLVLVVVLVAAFVLWLLDSGLGWLASRIIG